MNQESGEASVENLSVTVEPRCYRGRGEMMIRPSP